MEYMGIQYDIKKGIKRDEWASAIHTPNPREGKTSGSRDEAVSAPLEIYPRVVQAAPR
jgi:hypothetical protein